MHVWMLEVFLVICFHVTKSNIKNYNCLTVLMHIITLMRVMYLRYRFESITRDRKGPFFGLSTLCCAWAWMLWQDSCLEMFTTHPLVWNAHSVECSQLIRSLEMFVSHSITHSCWNFSFKSTGTGKEKGLQEKKAKHGTTNPTNTSSSGGLMLSSEVTWKNIHCQVPKIFGSVIERVIEEWCERDRER